MLKTKNLSFSCSNLFMDRQNVVIKEFDRIYSILRVNSANAFDDTTRRIIREVLSVTNPWKNIEEVISPYHKIR